MSQGYLQVAPLNCLSINGNVSNKHWQHSMSSLSELTCSCPLHTHHSFTPINLLRWGFWVWMSDTFYPIHQWKGTTLWPLLARYQLGSEPLSAQQWQWHDVWLGKDWMYCRWSGGEVLKVPATLLHRTCLNQLRRHKNDVTLNISATAMMRMGGPMVSFFCWR